jgi:hypothetical protein
MPDPQRSAGFRDQADTGGGVDRPRGRVQGPRRLGGRRRSLWRRPEVARGHSWPSPGLRDGDCGQPARAHPRRADPRRCPPRPAAQLPSCPAAQLPSCPGRNTLPAPAATAIECTRGPGVALWGEDDADTGIHHLLIRRNDATGEHAYLRCYSPRPVPLCALVAVAGQRWRIEESFQAAKGLVGLDQHQVRRWTSWHRWTTLAMLAHAFLAVAAATERDTHATPTGLITLTVNEFQRLFDALLLATHHTITSLLAWSRWRRQHLPSPTIPLPTTRKPMITIYGCSSRWVVRETARLLAAERLRAPMRLAFWLSPSASSRSAGPMHGSGWIEAKIS